MDELIKKGIRSVDIAKILDIDQAEVTQKIKLIRKEEKEKHIKKECCQIIINITSCNETSAGIVFETIKEMLKRENRG